MIAQLDRTILQHDRWPIMILPYTPSDMYWLCHERVSADADAQSTAGLVTALYIATAVFGRWQPHHMNRPGETY